jgi:hypothetical protein
MKPTVLITNKLSKGIMYQQLKHKEFIEEIDFITCFSFQLNSDSSLYRVQLKLN